MRDKMISMFKKLKAALWQQWLSFSYVGLVVGTLFFAASLTPSLLPRHYLVQGLMSGLAAAIGYYLGLGLVLLWLAMELPRPSAGLQRLGKLVTTLGVAAVAFSFLWRATVWQNSIRELMEMEPVVSAYPFEVAVIAFIVAAIMILVVRLIAFLWRWLNRRISRLVPKRVSYVITTILVVLGLLLVVNKIFAKAALNVADSVFLTIDMAVDEGLEPPENPMASGSSPSLVHWDTIGRRGKNFVLDGPTRQQIADFTGRDALQPLRVYAGLGTCDDMSARAQLALEELKRVGGFERSVLIVATPTGTGWLDPGGVDTVEYLHGGDTAMVSMQYSYLPSWITILVDPERSRASAQVLFDAIYGYWKTLPKDSRPRLYLHGLSLGSLGSESSADLFMIFEDPIQGGVWSGPPFPSPVWSRVTVGRNPDSSMWLPRFRDGSMLRFTAQQNTLDAPDHRWGPMRFVYVQYASDPMIFFSPNLLYRKPQWLDDPRGPDVSPYLRWFPIVTFLQVGMDLPMATSVPIGYGHNYAPEHYIDAWIAVTAPEGWTPDDIQRLKQYFRK